MKRIAIFPGSFDPFTKGHEDIVRRAIPLFDELYIAIGINSSKNYYYTTNSRLAQIKSIFKDEPAVKVEAYDGLTVNLCKEKKARYLLRGIRNIMDFEFERAIGQMNSDLAGIESVFLITDQKYSAISGTIVREINRNGGDISQFVTNMEELIITL
jgi:pantetheine-phosphate adenylyltransferase